MPSPLVSATELSALLASDTPPRVLDARWDLARDDGRELYLAGHIPGAVYIDMNTELATHGRPQDGRHPLPAPGVLQAAARRWGVNTGDTVVVCDDYNSVSAARAWWLLRQGGVADVRVLDGGIRAWADAGLPLDAVRIGHLDGDLYDPRCSWLRLRQIADDGAILVRPDRVVAWRRATAVENPRAALSEALGQVLARPDLGLTSTLAASGALA